MLDPLRTQGIARTATLRAHGWSRYEIEKAVGDGRLLRPRKGWVAHPNSDPVFLELASHSLVLTCVSAAKRLGLWVKHEQPRHFAVRHRSSFDRPEGCVLHWRQPLVPRDPDCLTDPIVNVLDVVARCQPFEEAVAIWDSALNKGLTDFLTLSRLPLKGVAKEVLAAASPFADSGLESVMRQRLRMFKVAVRSQSWVEGHRVDFLIGDRLVVQIDGGTHVGTQRTKDNLHDAELRLRGYTVIRVSYVQVMHRWHEVQELIQLAIGQGLHLAPAT